jgi:hypothetical protein
VPHHTSIYTAHEHSKSLEDALANAIKTMQEVRENGRPPEFESKDTPAAKAARRLSTKQWRRYNVPGNPARKALDDKIGQNTVPRAPKPRLTNREQFYRDLLDIDRIYGVALNDAIVRNLLKLCHRYLTELGKDKYREARNLALGKLVPLEATEVEWEAYKKIIDLRFQRRSKEAISLKHRPRAPVSALEDGNT